MSPNSRVLVVALAVVVLAAPRDGSLRAETPPAAMPTLSDLRDVSELKRLFNDDAGKVRLVLLLSPT